MNKSTHFFGTSVFGQLISLIDTEIITKAVKNNMFVLHFYGTLMIRNKSISDFTMFYCLCNTAIIVFRN